MKTKSKTINDNDKEVRSINKNIRSSTKKLNPILREIVGKKAAVAMNKVINTVIEDFRNLVIKFI